MLGTLFTLPDSSAILGGVGSTSSLIVSDFLPMVYLVVGVGLAIFIVTWLVGMFMHR